MQSICLCLFSSVLPVLFAVYATAFMVTVSAIVETNR